jgi:2-succinyl-6-hydroxy-2,4-cyclohexadiene-1-carboxylate synthase
MWMLIHGFTGSPRSWDEVVARAGLHQEPLLPTLLGHGSRWQHAKPRAFEDEVSRLASLASGLERPRLVCGYSMGARIALGMLASQSDLWDGAVLIGAHPGLADEAARAERRNVDSARMDLLKNEGLEAFVDAWEALPLFDTQQRISREVLAKQRELRLRHDADGLARALEVLGLAEMPDYGPALSSIPVPITLMAGACDSRFSSIALTLAEASVHIDAVLVEGVGHNVVLEAPAAVAAALSRIENRVGT